MPGSMAPALLCGGHNAGICCLVLRTKGSSAGGAKDRAPLVPSEPSHGAGRGISAHQGSARGDKKLNSPTEQLL